MPYTLLARFLFCVTRPKGCNLIIQFKGFLSLRSIPVLHYTVQGQYCVTLYGEFIFIILLNIDCSQEHVVLCTYRFLHAWFPSSVILHV